VGSGQWAVGSGQWAVGSIIWEGGMETFEKIKVGLSFERVSIVEQSMTTDFTKVPVLSTPMMIQLMEVACKDLIQELLPPEFVTVGYEVHVKHKAPSFLGAEVKTRCNLLEVEGRKLLFEVRVTEGEKVIGEGQHRRTIIPNN
jgi:fluoroacetyl-CoA thioesterase